MNTVDVVMDRNVEPWLACLLAALVALIARACSKLLALREVVVMLLFAAILFLLWYVILDLDVVSGGSAVRLMVTYFTVALLVRSKLK
jgi:hypothetical protein